MGNVVPWPYPDDGALIYYRDRALPAIARGEQWHWSLRLKSDPREHIGVVSLLKGENNNRGFWLGLPWQRQGLMTEAVNVITDYWFNQLGFSVMRVPKAVAEHRFPENFGKERDARCGCGGERITSADGF